MVFFLKKKKILYEDLNILSNLNCSIVFFISPKKINKAVPIIKQFFDDRKILICREITKFYEDIIRLNVKDLKLFDTNLKGEITIVLSEKIINKNTSNNLSESDKKSIKKMIKTLSIKDIVEFISQNKSISKKEIYNYCLKIKNEK